MPTEESQRIWVVDDDRSVRFVLATALRDAGYDVDGFDSAASALQALGTRGVPDLLFTDVRMPGEDGLKLLDRLKHAHPSLPVIVMSAYTDVASTAGAFRGGAQEFLSKPFDLDDAVALAARALPSLEPSEAAVAEPVAETRNGTPELIGDTPAMRGLFRAIGRLAQAPLSVLVTGETGTGKELVARALHNESPRARKPFVALNTAAIPAELLESELFGHEAGAFTGAQRRHIGRFEQADGGTLFLDEIGDMPLPLQTRLLRVLAEGEFFRVGGRELIRVDVRVIAATHQDLEGLVQAGRFRADLLHRLDVVRLQLPPLRERRGDVSRLAENFLAQACAKLGMPAKRVAPSAREALRAHDWPGNVRELENVCWRLAALAPSDTITVGDVEQALPHGARSSTRDAADWDALLGQWARARLAEGADGLHAEARTRLDRALLEAALQFTNGRRADAAARLGVGRNTITRKLGSGRRRS
ncbi:MULTISPECIES: nitrogen regulation protein NR(I) [Pseudoxanthomonas]|jgi:two-component system nitrogen regulation response regulator GlnG|uniref:DNA-binding transcriptional regulator NtrC n=1 Tax=Pseudoxanthomonas winnipegensis TaxID=2480810 RepID=A0A4Q8LBP1_9GAMM|nr:nitrogen regulation protein NR(I) [Pseudoxanthomonas winnipegensis]RZZ83214.1 nitrogen regulation protein NR(I) [Pseudoxanthomonas winnipegensis]TAA07555.1 nitrogen regulation protein NR(I) [Pseudoxanthomonas winnipegensis]TAA17582.1 nitrogen regulation protein NR(I) [Pseudoxanthomonas winnipegensis]TAA26189.1 nitrogen regulation protein NR(I) [Pseudoxanthomonas winnipegensis]TAA39280.1 nitrogen regulation protein NR(I) [Pseudoxanthomonas winnipegensis]